MSNNTQEKYEANYLLSSKKPMSFFAKLILQTQEGWFCDELLLEIKPTGLLFEVL